VRLVLLVPTLHLVLPVGDWQHLVAKIMVKVSLRVLLLKIAGMLVVLLLLMKRVRGFGPHSN